MRLSVVCAIFCFVYFDRYSTKWSVTSRTCTCKRTLVVITSLLVVLPKSSFCLFAVLLHWNRDWCGCLEHDSWNACVIWYSTLDIHEKVRHTYEIRNKNETANRCRHENPQLFSKEKTNAHTTTPTNKQTLRFTRNFRRCFASKCFVSWFLFSCLQQRTRAPCRKW